MRSNRFTVRTRLLVAVLVPVALAVVVMTGNQVYNFNKYTQAQTELLREDLLKSRQESLKEMISGVKAQVQALKDNPELSREEAQQRARDRIREFGFGHNNYIFAYEGTQFNLAFRPDPSIEGPMKNTEPRHMQILQALWAAARQGGFFQYTFHNPATEQEEPKLSYQTVIPEWNWMIGAGVYIADIDKSIATAKLEAEQEMSSLIKAVIGISLVVVIVSVIIGLIVGRTITNPLGKVIVMMKEIASGDGDLRQRLPAEGKDELAELGRRFNDFVDKIHKTIEEVGATTDQVATAAEELSRVADETRASVQGQGAETDQIASAINEMAATIHQVSGNASEVQSSASDADRLARDGGSTIVTAQDTVTALSSDIESSAQAINALADKSRDIQQILDVIHAVTDQTNLLALNAAIEAARAGDHGRGFAVVAEEVRNLAKKSAESADQIGTMIEGFVAEANLAVERMQASRNRSTESVERINHATDALRSIEKSVGVIHEQVTQIATAAEEQSQVAEEINQNVVRIVDSAQQSESGVNQTNEASQELARLGERLRELVSQFKV